MKRSLNKWMCLAALGLALLACRPLTDLLTPTSPSAPTPPPSPTLPPNLTVQPPQTGSEEPVFISGEIPYTSPFFLATTAEPFVMLEDQAGFVRRDREFEFALASQVIGPVTKGKGQVLYFSLPLPMVPQATYLDVDNDGEEDSGVQIFAIAYWSNTWGDPFLERRDGTGWSNAYASTRTDPENDYEIIGGTLLIWAPDDQQGFPTDFGPDGKLFTADDPTTRVPAGYSLVDLDQRPFRIYKESRPYLKLIEGATAVNDYSGLSYGRAFAALFDKASREYPFTELKGVNWEDLRQRFTPLFEKARNRREFYQALRQFTLAIPDSHVGMEIDPELFFEEYGGGFGLVLTELSDGRLLVREVLPNLPAERAGIQKGAEILSWNGKPVNEALAAVVPGFAPYSTPHALRFGQVQFLSRVPPNTRLEVVFKNPAQAAPQSATLSAAMEYDSLFRTIPSFAQDKLSLPVEGRTLPNTELGYLRIATFQDDYNLMARLWERYLENLIEEKIPGVIIDVRANSGGSLGMALDFAGYFFKEEFVLYENYYYNDNTQRFESTGYPTRIRPAPQYYEGVVAVLIGPDCISACEGFAYAMQQQGRAIIVGHSPSAGAFGEVGQGQYKLPGNINLQFPTGRSLTSDGQIVLEGRGVVPDILVPITEESALGLVDAVLQAAIQALQQKLP